VVLGAVGLLLTSGCDRQPTSPSDVASVPFRFAVAPVDVQQIRSIERIVYRPNRVYPYLQIHHGISGGVVQAPADATVTAVTTTGSSTRIDFLASSGLRYYLAELASSEVGAGTTVVAGQPVGRAGQQFESFFPVVGFGVINPARPQPFITPARYPDEMRYGDSPIRYFNEPLKGALMAKVQPSGLGEGLLSFDIPGTLQGFWFLATVPISESMAEANREARLWFYYNDLNPVERLITYYSPELTLTGDRVPNEEPVASQVTPASGVVSFHFSERVGEFPTFENRVFVLLVEMLSATSLRAEAFDTTLVPSPAFTAGARTYVR